jgi:GNAT superfamily N-acetyltransferase
VKDETNAAIEKYWAQEFGFASGFGELQICCKVQHLYSGVQMFRRDRLLIIAVPPELHDLFQDAIDHSNSKDLFSVDWLQSVLGSRAEKIIGPALVYYADETTFDSKVTDGDRMLADSDSDAYRDLQSALNATELYESGLSAEHFPAFGAFSEGKLFAVASYSIWEPSIAHIIVATHPDHRRQGFAKRAVSVLAAHALDRGLILQWRALAWNTNSLSLAIELGFQHYCSTIFARL